MAHRVTRKEVQIAFENCATVMGWDRQTVVKTAEGYKHVQDTVALDYAPIYGGYQIELMNANGSVKRILNGSRMSGKEMIAWLDGVQYAANILSFIA